MQFRILGPLEVTEAGQVLSPGGPRVRTALAMLLLHANRVVSVDALTDALWPDQPPASARQQVHNAVSALRRMLADQPAGEPAAIVTCHPGYRLDVAADAVDLQVFERYVGEARRLRGAGEVTGAANALRAALALWRGPVLDGLDADRIRAEAVRLAELRLAVVEERVEADLRLGRHQVLVAELTGLVAEHPLRERLRGQLMLALYRTDRQAEALTVYQAGRRALAEEFGLEPGPELRALAQAVLTDDPALAVDPPAGPRGDPRRDPRGDQPPGPADPPAQLPRDVADFTGREDEAAALTALLGEPAGGGHRTAPAIAVIAGPAGVGKTTLAVHAGHRLRAGFPDGQLFVDLAGAGERPADPAEVLARLLEGLGVPNVMVPDALAARAALYRSRLADRRLLVVLDNAASVAQVSPLLPGAAGCAALVTSRSRLAGLPGAGLVELGVFDTGRALALLGAIAGPDRVAAARPAAERVAQLCGRLPLALRIAGAKVAGRPHWDFARLAARLADERRRLDELSLADQEVRASVALSYAGLGLPARRALRLLSLLDAPDFGARTVAALLRTPATAAEDLIDLLVDAHMIEYAGRDHAGQCRYRCHDLVRLCARERAAAEDSMADRGAAVGAALRAWREDAVRAMWALPWQVAPALAPRPPSGQPPDPDPAGDPLAWFETERTALAAGVAQAYRLGLDAECVPLALALAHVADLRGHDHWRAALRTALAAARRLGDRRAEATVLLYQGSCSQDHRPAESSGHYRAALQVARELGDEAVATVASIGLGFTAWLHDEGPEAQRALADALRAADRLDDQHSVALATRRLARNARDDGELAEAERLLRRAAELFDRIGDRRGVAKTLYSLSEVDAALGRTGKALDEMAQVLHICRELGDRVGEPFALVGLAGLHSGQGHRPLARSLAEQAIALFDEIYTPTGRATGLYVLGQVHRLDGRLPQALACLHESLDLWRSVGSPIWQDRVTDELAAVRTAQGPGGSTGRLEPGAER